MGTKQAMFDAARRIEAAGTGYDQSERWSFLNIAARTINNNREADCSSFCGGVAYLGGYLQAGDIGPSVTFYTGNFAAVLQKRGFSVLTYTKLTDLRPGDFVLSTRGHVEFVYSDGRFVSANIDENGRASGGRAGDQTGGEVYFKNPYNYSKGWTHIVRPPADASAGSTSSKTDAELAAEVLAGKHGNGEARKRSLGSRYDAVQAIVNGKTGSSSSSGSAILENGSSGSEVRRLQTGLNKVFPAYSNLVVDGEFGAETERVVKEYQRRSGLTADGVVGPLTSAALVRSGVL